VSPSVSPIDVLPIATTRFSDGHSSYGARLVGEREVEITSRELVRIRLRRALVLAQTWGGTALRRLRQHPAANLAAALLLTLGPLLWVAFKR
jgi:hypothetical protein